MKGKAHFSNLSHTFLKTSSPGIAATRPDLSSSRRRFASLAHCLSISDSGWFRLRNSESTTRARSSTGSDTASSISCFVFMFIPLSNVAYRAERHANRTPNCGAKRGSLEVRVYRLVGESSFPLKRSCTHLDIRSASERCSRLALFRRAEMSSESRLRNDSKTSNT